MTFAQPFRRTSLALIVGLVVASGAAMAQTPPSPPAGPPAGMHGDPRMAGPQNPLMEGITLSPAQQAKVDAILKKDGPEMRERMMAAGKARKDLDDMVWSGSFDPVKAHSLADAGAKNLADLVVEHAHTESELLAVLTPDQLAQAKINHDKLTHGGFGHGPQGPGGPRMPPQGDAPGPRPAP